LFSRESHTCPLCASHFCEADWARQLSTKSKNMKN
jgi:hypothetical protein